MIAALHGIVASLHPRPAGLSNEGCCYSDDHLAAILAKPDDDLGWTDFQTLLTIARCTGTYEELVYFVPPCIRYCGREPGEALDCLSQLVYFLSHEFDRLRDDGLAEPVVEALRELFARWTDTFHVAHYDLAACRAKGWRLDHDDVVDRMQVVGDLVDDLLRYETFAGLAEELIGSLAALPAGGPRSAWYLAYAYECRTGYARWVQARDRIRDEMRSLLAAAGADGTAEHDDTPPWSRSGHIVRLANDTDLLRRHYAGIEATVVAVEPSPTYWSAVRGLLDFPAADRPADPAAVPRFSVADAKAYRSQPETATPPQAEPRSPLLPKMQAQRDRLLAAMKALAPSTGTPEDEVLAGTAALFEGMGTKFRGRVPGLERDVTFRFLLVSGNFALCENDDGPLRIPFKEFVAACEAGELVEVPGGDDPAGEQTGNL